MILVNVVVGARVLVPETVFDFVSRLPQDHRFVHDQYTHSERCVLVCKLLSTHISGSEASILCTNAPLSQSTNLRDFFPTLA